jgi:hypothetical protein
VALPVARDRHRVDRIDRPTGRPQRCDQQTAWCLDRDRDRVLGGIADRSEHLDEFGEPCHRLADSSLRDQATGLVDQGDLVVAFGPVDPAEHLHTVCTSSSRYSVAVRTLARTRGALMTRLCGLPSDEPFAIPATPTAPVCGSELEGSR